MPTHLSVINLSPIRARPAPSKVSATSFPMVLGRDARAQALGRRCGLAPAPPLVLPAPPRPAPPRPWCCPPRPSLPPGWCAARALGQGHVVPPRPVPPRSSWFKATFIRVNQSYLYARGSRKPLLARFFYSSRLKVQRREPKPWVKVWCSLGSFGKIPPVAGTIGEAVCCPKLRNSTSSPRVA